MLPEGQWTRRVRGMLRGPGARPGHRCEAASQLALRDIARGTCASELCKPLGRHVTTVLKWVHDFNQRGPAALIYRPSGGAPAKKQRLVSLIHEALGGAQQAAAQSKKRRSRR